MSSLDELIKAQKVAEDKAAEAAKVALDAKAKVAAASAEHITPTIEKLKDLLASASDDTKKTLRKEANNLAKLIYGKGHSIKKSVAKKKEKQETFSFDWDKLKVKLKDGGHTTKENSLSAADVMKVYFGDAGKKFNSKWNQQKSKIGWLKNGGAGKSSKWFVKG